MNKNFLNSVLSMLLLVSANANAASTLQWKANSVDVLPNTDITLSQAVEPGIDEQLLLDASSNEINFTQAWSFNVATKTTTSREAVNFFNTQHNNTYLNIDNVFVAGSELGITTQWAFSTLLASGSRQSLKIATGSENITAGFSAPKNDIQLATTPIPAIAWLLGSCLLGICGLLCRRESVPVITYKLNI